MAGDVFVGVRVVGGLLPSDVLSRLSTGQGVSHLEPADFHLAGGESVRDAANRVWPYLQGAWSSYRAAIDALPEGTSTTSTTREKFLLVLLDQLGYGRVQPTGRGGLTADGNSFPISHAWQSVPMHLLGSGTSLDTRTKGVAGAATGSPQSMVQDFLNRSDVHLWAILSNGQVLRLLRDSTSLVGSAYVEFDLEAIFSGELFADFVLLFTLCHQSRLEVRDPEIGASSCRLESWRTEALATGSRALNQLRDGVLEALRTLGTGFLTNPANTDLRQRLSSGSLSVDDFHHALLRVVYRLLFTFVAEDRGVLLDPEADATARQRYADYFSTSRLRRVARRRAGSRHGDRWHALTLVWRGLGSEDGLHELGLSGIGGLFDRGELDFLANEQLSNEALLRAVRSLSLVREPHSGVLRVIDYRNLGAEELGSIYEALLEFVPQWDPEAKQYTLEIAAGNQRKDTGSYYTPTSLVDSLLDTALEPVLDDAAKSKNPQAALLRVTVCDPACGSGHFLVGAARRIAKRLAIIRTGDPEPAPEAVRAAIRDVTGNCIYGADINPLAAELAKVSLWMEALEPGQPLSFLDAQIKIGNALIGATPNMLERGLPDDAFKPIEGDEKEICDALKKQNRAQRANQVGLYDVGELLVTNTSLAEEVGELLRVGALSLNDVHVQQNRLNAYTESPEYQQARLTADAWCAAFVWPKYYGAPEAITHDDIVNLNLGVDPLTSDQHEEIAHLTAQYRFFHWHLEYPHLFPTSLLPGDTVNAATGWAGGFTVVIGNPPWENIELKEQEYFAIVDPEIALASGDRRKRLIRKFEQDRPAAYKAFTAEKRRIAGFRHYASTSGRFPLTARGRLKTDPLFAEVGRHLLASEGRFGMILPTGIATDANTQYFFNDLVETHSLASLYDFENRRGLFEDVHRSQKFCLLTLTGRQLKQEVADFAFFVHDPKDLARQGVRFQLTPAEIKLLSPNTGTCPTFRSRHDAEVTLGIYNRIPVLIDESKEYGNPWGVTFAQGLFNLTSDSGLFHSAQELEADGWRLHGNEYHLDTQRMVPLYEAKMLAAYDHRAADVVKSATAEKRQNQPRYLTENEHADPERLPLPLSWVREQDLPAFDYSWLTGFSDVTSPTNERTMISSALPFVAVGHTYPLYFTSSPDDRAILLACFNSFCFDYLSRQKVAGLHFTYTYLRQIPVITPEKVDAECPWARGMTVRDWLYRRVASLVCTAFDMTSFGHDLLGRDLLTPWNEPQRRVLRAEIDAAMFVLYEVSGDDVDFILESFSTVKRHDLAKFGAFRTKTEIVSLYDGMRRAMRD